MQLGVGPVSLVALLTGSLMEKYDVQYISDANAAARIFYNYICQVANLVNVDGFCCSSLHLQWRFNDNYWHV